MVESDRSSTLLLGRTGSRSSGPLAMVVLVVVVVKLSRCQVAERNQPEIMAGAEFFGEF